MRTTTPSVENTWMETCADSGDNSANTCIAVCALHLGEVSLVQDKIDSGSGQTLESQFKMLFILICSC